MTGVWGKMMKHFVLFLCSHYAGEDSNTASSSSKKKLSDQMDNILDIREHDVPYHVRVAIDEKIHVVSRRNKAFSTPMFTI